MTVILLAYAMLAAAAWWIAGTAGVALLATCTARSVWAAEAHRLRPEFLAPVRGLQGPLGQVPVSAEGEQRPGRGDR